MLHENTKAKIACTPPPHALPSQKMLPHHQLILKTAPEVAELSEVQVPNKPVLSWVSHVVIASLCFGHDGILGPGRTEHFCLKPLNIVTFAMLNASGHCGERC